MIAEDGGRPFCALKRKSLRMAATAIRRLPSAVLC
jgi:hypothetical protein